jgi:hypothetical protein
MHASDCTNEQLSALAEELVVAIDTLMSSRHGISSLFLDKMRAWQASIRTEQEWRLKLGAGISAFDRVTGIVQ